MSRKPRMLQSEQELSNPAVPISNPAQARFVAELREIGATSRRRQAEETSDPHERALLLAQAEAYAATAAGIRAKLDGTPCRLSRPEPATPVEPTRLAQPTKLAEPPLGRERARRMRMVANASDAPEPEPELTPSLFGVRPSSTLN